MKNYIMGIAMIILLSMFTIFQIDFNNAQTEEIRLCQVANDAARAFALQVDLESYSEGYITFDIAEGLKKGSQVIKDSLKFDDGSSGLKFYGDNEIKVYFAVFNQCEEDTSLCPGLNKMYVINMNTNDISGPTYYSRGNKASSLIPSGVVTMPSGIKNQFDPVINYPSVLCIIDAGEVPFRLGGLRDIANIKIGGIYEYKW